LTLLVAAGLLLGGLVLVVLEVDGTLVVLVLVVELVKVEAKLLVVVVTGALEPAEGVVEDVVEDERASVERVALERPEVEERARVTVKVLGVLGGATGLGGTEVLALLPLDGGGLG
jgi:hypothetical protein